MCDNPACDGHRKSFAEIQEQQMQTILEHGHQILAVFGDKQEDFLAYSIGRCVRGKPEFVTTGSLPQVVSGHMINEAARLMDEEQTPVQDGYEFPPNTLLTGFPCRVVEVDPEQYHLNGIWNLFGRDQELRVLQLVWPDVEGRWPDDPEFSHIQPIHPLEGSTS